MDPVKVSCFRYAVDGAFPGQGSSGLFSFGRGNRFPRRLDPGNFHGKSCCLPPTNSRVS